MAAAIAQALLVALAACGKVLLFHTIILGVVLVGIAAWAGWSAGVWRGISAGIAALIVHLLVAPFVLIQATIIAAGAGVRKFGVARKILAAALERAGKLDPRITDHNDYEQFTKALAAAFDDLTSETGAAAAGRVAWVRSLTSKLARRIVQIVGRITLRQLDLAHRNDAPPAHATLDEWLGSRIDAMVESTLRDPARRAMIFLIVVQLLITIGCIVGAVKVPPLW